MKVIDGQDNQLVGLLVIGHNIERIPPDVMDIHSGFDDTEQSVVLEKFILSASLTLYSSITDPSDVGQDNAWVLEDASRIQVVIVKHQKVGQVGDLEVVEPDPEQNAKPMS